VLRSEDMFYMKCTEQIGANFDLFTYHDAVEAWLEGGWEYKATPSLPLAYNFKGNQLAKFRKCNENFNKIVAKQI